METKKKIYKFKDVKNSVRMRMISTDGVNCMLENTDYIGLIYHTTIDKLEEVKDESTN